MYFFGKGRPVLEIPNYVRMRPAGLEPKSFVNHVGHFRNDVTLGVEGGVNKDVFNVVNPTLGNVAALDADGAKADLKRMLRMIVA